MLACPIKKEPKTPNLQTPSILLVLAVNIGAQSSMPDTFVRINGGNFTVASGWFDSERIQ
jgi:hypothetical protein